MASLPGSGSIQITRLRYRALRQNNKTRCTMKAVSIYASRPFMEPQKHARLLGTGNPPMDEWQQDGSGQATQDGGDRKPSSRKPNECLTNTRLLEKRPKPVWEEMGAILSTATMPSGPCGIPNLHSRANGLKRVPLCPPLQRHSHPTPAYALHRKGFIHMQFFFPFLHH
jgi:hypothetical protein